MEDASGKPATTAATAFVDALTRLGAKKIAIGAPWSKTMDKPMVDFMETSGFEVVHSEVVGFVASIELGRVGPAKAYALGLRTDRPDADAILTRVEEANVNFRPLQDEPVTPFRCLPKLDVDDDAVIREIFCPYQPVQDPHEEVGIKVLVAEITT